MRLFERHFQQASRLSRHYFARKSKRPESKSPDTLFQVQLDIVASAPQHLGSTPRHESPATGKSIGTFEEPDSHSAYKSLWTNFTLPLSNPFDGSIICD